jgi:hypothetical protein
VSEGSRKDRLDVSDIAKQLSEGRLSRHGLIERLTALGIGFGAAFVLGIGGANASARMPDASVALTSSNPALNAILQDGPQVPEAREATPLQKMSYYRFFRRFYYRHYRRFYHRFYRRFYHRY